MPAAAHLHRLRVSLEGRVTLGGLAQRLGRDGAGLLLVLVCVPFLHPFPMAGLTIPVGLLITATGVQLALGHETPYLPRFVSVQDLDAARVERILRAAEKVLVFLERFTHPRLRPAARATRLIGLAIAATGFFFALPLYFPFGNMLSAAGLILMGLGLLEEDGLAAVAGLLLAAVSFAYHVAGVAFAWHELGLFAHRRLSGG